MPAGRLPLLTYLSGKGISTSTFTEAERQFLNYMSIDTTANQVYFETTNFSFPLSHKSDFCWGHGTDPLLIDAGESKGGWGSGSEHQEIKEAEALDQLWQNADEAQQASLLTILRVLEEADDDVRACIHSDSDFATALRRG